MAVVKAPFVARRYNHNARGSATATVLMRANNPWERRSTLMNSPLAGGALPGMSGLGDADPLPTSNGTDMAAAGATALTTAFGAAQQLATARIMQLYGNGATALPIANANAKPAVAAAPSSSALPIVLGVSGLALVAFLFLRKK